MFRFREGVRFALLFSTLIVFALLSAAFAAPDESEFANQGSILVVGFSAEDSGYTMTKNSAKQLTDLMAEKLGQGIKGRVFDTSEQLMRWLTEFREIDIAIISGMTAAEISAKDLRVLAQEKSPSSSAQTKVFAVRGTLEEMQGKVAKALLAMDQSPVGQNALKAIGVSSFELPPAPKKVLTKTFTASGAVSVKQAPIGSQSEKPRVAINPSPDEIAPAVRKVEQDPVTTRTESRGTPPASEPKVVAVAKDGGPQPLVVGFTTDNKGFRGEKAGAEALSRQMEEDLSMPVKTRSFSSEESLYSWLANFREVDIALLNDDFLRQRPVGQVVLVANAQEPFGKEGERKIVAHLGVEKSILDKISNSLTGLEKDSHGKGVLKELNVSRFVKPAVVKPAKIADLQRQTIPPQRKPVVIGQAPEVGAKKVESNRDKNPFTVKSGSARSALASQSTTQEPLALVATATASGAVSDKQPLTGSQSEKSIAAVSPLPHEAAPAVREAGQTPVAKSTESRGIPSVNEPKVVVAAKNDGPQPLVVGFATDTKGFRGEKAGAEALRKQMEEALSMPVKARSFSSAESLYSWLANFREVDIALLDDDFLKQRPVGEVVLVVNEQGPSGKEGKRKIVAHLGVEKSILDKISNSLANLEGDTHGKEVLKELNVNRFVKPAVVKPAKIADQQIQTIPPQRKPAVVDQQTPPVRTQKVESNRDENPFTVKSGSAQPASVSQSTTEKPLILGFAANDKSAVETKKKAEATSRILQDLLATPVKARSFADEKSLYRWLQTFREVDIALFSDEFIKTTPVGELTQLAQAETANKKAMPGKVVVHQGVSLELREKIHRALLALGDNPEGQELLAQMGFSQFSVIPKQKPLRAVTKEKEPVVVVKSSREQQPLAPVERVKTSANIVAKRIEQSSNADADISAEEILVMLAQQDEVTVVVQKEAAERLIEPLGKQEIKVFSKPKVPTVELQKATIGPQKKRTEQAKASTNIAEELQEQAEAAEPIVEFVGTPLVVTEKEPSPAIVAEPAQAENVEPVKQADSKAVSESEKLTEETPLVPFAPQNQSSSNVTNQVNSYSLSSLFGADEVSVKTSVGDHYVENMADVQLLGEDLTRRVPDTDLSESIKAGRTFSRDSLAAQKRSEQAAAQTGQALGLLLPQVTMRVAYGSETSMPGVEIDDDTGELIKSDRHERTDTALTVRQTLFDLPRYFDWKRRQVTELARKENQRISDGDAYLATVDSYLSLVSSRLQADVTRGFEDQLAELLDYIEKRASAGAASVSDMARVRARIQATLSSRLEQEAAHATAGIEFVRLTNVAPGTVRMPAPDDIGQAILPSTFKEAVEAAMSTNPEIQALASELEAAKVDMTAAKSRYLPRLDAEYTDTFSLGAGGSKDKDGQRDKRLMAVLNWELFSGGKDRQYNIERAARHKELQYRLDDQRRRVVETLSANYTALETTRERLTTSYQELESISTAADAMSKRMLSGKQSLLDLLDVYDRYYQVRSRLVNLHILEMNTISQLVRLTHGAPWDETVQAMWTESEDN